MLNTLAIAMIKNEADIVEAFVRHNLAFLDLLVVIDNGSTDGTRDILTALQREGLPVLVFDDPIFGYFQSEKVTHVYRKVAPVFQPDVVWFLDADEFIHAPSRAALDAALASIPLGGCALLPWRTQVPTPGADPRQRLADPLASLPGRRRREEPVYYKAVLRRRPQDDAQLVVEQGNHMVHLEDGTRPATVTIDGAALAHLPVRSLEQLSAKVINGWHAYLVKNRRQQTPTMGFQWQVLYERLVHGAGIDEATLTQVALDYAQAPRADRHPDRDIVADPVPSRYGTLRHLALARTGLLARVALNMEAYLAQDAAPATPAPADARPPRDLAGLLALLRQTGAQRLAAAPGGGAPALAAELCAANPAWTAAGDGPADLLLATDTDIRAFGAAAANAMSQAPGHVVWWPRAGRATGAEDMDDALQAWYAAGWEPQALLTMGLRALSSHPALRQGAVVLHPVAPGRDARAAALRAMLCGLAAEAAAHPAPTPAGLPPRILHPLQDLALAATAR